VALLKAQGRSETRVTPAVDSGPHLFVVPSFLFQKPLGPTVTDSVRAVGLAPFRSRPIHA
jgi:hypothetical protein